jgi:SET domain
VAHAGGLEQLNRLLERSPSKVVGSRRLRWGTRAVQRLRVGWQFVQRRFGGEPYPGGDSGSGALEEAEYEPVMLYLNRSCEPNVGSAGNVVLVAMRDVQPAEELTTDYAFFRSGYVGSAAVVTRHLATVAAAVARPGPCAMAYPPGRITAGRAAERCAALWGCRLAGTRTGEPVRQGRRFPPNHLALVGCRPARDRLADSRAWGAVSCGSASSPRRPRSRRATLARGEHRAQRLRRREQRRWQRLYVRSVSVAGRPTGR